MQQDVIYKAFQNVEQLVFLFSSTAKVSAVGQLRFERVAGNSSDPYDEDVQSEARFCVWKCGDIFVKLIGYVTSYGDRTPERWDFVEPKEKVVLVYE